MSRKMRPYGTYNDCALMYPVWYGDRMDVQETNDSLAQGCRIRNKKAKRRLHNKTTRNLAKIDINKEVVQYVKT